MYLFRRVTALVVFLLAPVAGFAEVVGVVVAVERGALVERGSETRVLRTRSDVETGDLIRTDANGSVQIAFRDRTRIVVGPDTEFRVDEVSIAGDGRVRRFIVSALSGVFRFLSGDAAKEVYELNTPTATLGIRGTVFDVALDDAGATWLLTYEGEVRMCGASRRCARISGGCAMASTKTFGRIAAPSSRRVRDAAINTVFPLTVDQSGLTRDFRARTESCGDVDRGVMLAPTRSRVPTGNRPPRRDSADNGSAGSGLIDRTGGSSGTGGGAAGGGGSGGGGSGGGSGGGTGGGGIQ